jgi:hypothetical protein
VYSLLVKRKPGSCIAQMILALVLIDEYLTVLSQDSNLVMPSQVRDDLRDCVLATSEFIRDRDSRLALISARIMSKFAGLKECDNVDIMSIVLSKGFVTISLIIDRVDHISQGIRDISLSTIETFPLDITLKLPDYPSANHQAKMSILRIPFIGSLRSLHFDAILASLFGMSDKLSGYRNTDGSGNDDLEWLARIYHTSQTKHYLTAVNVETSRELLVFWATWSVCQYLVIGKLKSSLGNAAQVFYFDSNM